MEQVSDAGHAMNDALTAGAMPYLVRGKGFVSVQDALAAIATALSFPDYFGGNLDALFDCLVDLSWLPAGEHVLIWQGPDVLESADFVGYLGIKTTLADAVAARRPTGRTLRVVLADH